MFPFLKKMHRSPDGQSGLPGSPHDWLLLKAQKQLRSFGRHSFWLWRLDAEVHVRGNMQSSLVQQTLNDLPEEEQ